MDHTEAKEDVAAEHVADVGSGLTDEVDRWHATHCKRLEHRPLQHELW